MTAQVLVVDDNERNLKLLEALLTNEYYDVILAHDGFEALEITKTKKPDIILLDVMMPGMDGFETCKKLKENPATAHIPVVMVTALSDRSDRVKGLESGADDFLTKPVKEVPLLARVRSLVRFKVILDELRLRDKTGSSMELDGNGGFDFDIDLSDSRILVVDDDVVEAKQVQDQLSKLYRIDLCSEPEKAQEMSLAVDYDLIIISTQLYDADGLRICSQIRSNEKTRSTAIIIMVDNDDERSLVKGLEIGVNDYVIAPIDHSEMLARVKTQVKRKKYQDAIKTNYKQKFSMAVTDSLTGLHNRHFLNAHLENLVSKSNQDVKPLSLMILDMDHFKMVNDTYGHDVGDQVLVELAKRITNGIRTSDLAARVGGEEFVIVMPNASLEAAMVVAERIRKSIEEKPFLITHSSASELYKTVSIGLSILNQESDDVASLMKRADDALYMAKNNGRNQVRVIS